MTETYRIVLNSPMGPREGTLQLTAAEHAVDGTLTLLGHVNPVHGMRMGAGQYSLACVMYTGIEPVSCSFTLEVSGGSLHGWADTSRGRMAFSGTLADSFHMTEGQK